MRAVVVGGGIIGCSIAYHLQKAGAETVLLERGQIGSEASGAAAGLLTPPSAAMVEGPFRDLCLASQRLYAPFLEEVQARSDLDAECLASGILVLAENEGEVKPLQAYARRQDEGVLPTTWIDAAAVRKLEPALAPHIAGAAFSPDARHVNPRLLTEATARAAQRLGARVVAGASLTGFIGRGERLLGASTNLNDFRCDAIVLAAGPWTGLLLKRLGVRLPTPPMRGQMIAYRSNSLRHAVWGDDGYLVPKTGGVVFAGATVEDVGFRKTTTVQGISGLARMAGGLVPALRGALPAGAWAGLRPGSPDGLPVLGRLPGRDNVYVATGHFRNGILLAPITGQLISQLIVEGRTEMDLAPFGAERFA